MVGAAAGIELQVGPVAEVAVAPHWDSGGGAVGGRGAGGAGEALEVPQRPLRGAEGGVLRDGGEAVPAVFFVGVAGEVGLLAGYIHHGLGGGFSGDIWMGETGGGLTILAKAPAAERAR